MNYGTPFILLFRQEHVRLKGSYGDEISSGCFGCNSGVWVYDVYPALSDDRAGIPAGGCSG